MSRRLLLLGLIPLAALADAFTPDQGDAHVIVRVAEVRCGARDAESQVYAATLDVEKVLRGKVGKRVEIDFRRYFDGGPRLGDNGLSFLRGDRAELVLTRYGERWAVQFPFHRRVITASAGMLPSCGR